MGNLDKQKLFSEGVKLHELGIHGDKNAVKEAYDTFTRILEMDPEDLVAEAYLGSITSLIGRDSVDPNQKLRLALKGLKILDKAVSKDPQNIEIRSIRAHVNFNLPEMFFHRTLSAIDDFNVLVTRYEHDTTAFTEEYYWQVLYDLGVSYKRLGKTDQAKEVWTKLALISKDPKHLERINQEK